MPRNKPKLHIGTSGWNYKHWKENFYPGDIKESRLFSYYIKNFSTVEINNSFYHLPKKETFEDWSKQAPDGFVFSVKASRYITHMKKLKDPQEATKKFFDAVDGLGSKLGPILFQLPPYWKANPERLESFLKQLPSSKKSGYKYVFEFRDDSWFSSEVKNILEKYNAAFCIYDLEQNLSPLWVTADFVYIRLHGPDGAYQGKYSQDQLEEWRDRFREWNKTVYCYFDNDEEGYAPQNALELKNML